VLREWAAGSGIRNKSIVPALTSRAYIYAYYIVEKKTHPLAAVITDAAGIDSHLN
jgi:hypothetical protein